MEQVSDQLMIRPGSLEFALRPLRLIAPEDSVRMTVPWWQPGVIYQIYPRSFQDSERRRHRRPQGDRATARLSGRRSGVDAIWISPIFPSPMADFGYDVADYCDVDPLFGTLADFDRLLAQAHARGLKVILDFVPNHTSDQHPWFVESRILARQPEARLVHLARSARRTAARPTTGSAISAARHGNGTRPPASTTTTPS